MADFAHLFGAKLYVTVNTIVYDNELRNVEKLIKGLYHAGTDALIVQDMALLQLDLPPIALHASTQCDTRTPAQARFLQDAGFSQIVLPRELSPDEIKNSAAKSKCRSRHSATEHCVYVTAATAVQDSWLQDGAPTGASVRRCAGYPTTL